MRALAIMAAAVLLFTGIDTSAKWLIVSGLPALQVVFARYAGHFLTALVTFLPREGAGAFRSQVPRLQLLRSAALLLSTIFNFYALKFLPITVTTAIYFSAPIVISALSVPILGERIGIRRLAAILTGFLGVMVVIQPWGASFHPAMALSVTGLGFAALYFVLTRKIAGIEANATSQLWASGMATLILTPVALSVWVWPATAAGWVLMALIGVFGAAGHICATLAHRFADASTLAPVTYLQVIFATTAGYVVFGNLPTGWTIAGAAIIIASGVYIWQRERARMLARRAGEAGGVPR
ncbi:MAG: EamA/RhaT family transporter [Alphaproteobacteria bacterium HGW-Alphaproteobacteria-6]|nr:MAG: EamA/RhaT family transporter [Alphaproteobacteria bacterium HGW-Alphaproteobacteria-6]